MAEKLDSQQRSARPLNTIAWSRWLLILALPIIVGIFYASASAHFGYTPDDTYIYLQFAKNLIGGNGISFNPGIQTYGFTSPLWLFIISLGGALGLDVYFTAKVIDLVFASLALIVFYLLAYEMIRDVAVAVCATIAFSVNAWFLRWTGTGMETSLSVLLVLAVMLFCFRNEYFTAIVMAALLFLVRPETALIVPVILADVYINSLNKKRAVNMAGALVLIYLALILPWLVTAYMKFGAVLPNTAFAKAGFRPGISELSATGFDILQTVGAADGAAVLVLFACGVALIVKKKTIGTNGQGDPDRFFLLRQGLLGAGWITIMLLFYLVADVNVVSRYLLIVTPLAVILAFSALYYMVFYSSAKRYAYGAVFLLTAIVMLQNQIFYRQVVSPGIISFEQGMEHCLIPIGKWLNHNTPPGTNVVTGDIGAIGYYSERDICDAAGIVSPDARMLLRNGNTADDIIEKKLYSSLCSPDYVIHRAPEPDKLKTDPDLEPLLSRPFVGLSLADQSIMYYTLYKVKR